jgi:cysteinyl-tRNA synthetase
MGTKYLGETFDIHGGGLDLQFPHHECEIAQSMGAYGTEPARYWIHTNMLTVNGQKMSKSLGNSFLPEELITGNHELLDQAYSPMTVRFFMLQSHYSSTLDFSNEALKAAQKGYKKLINSLRLVNSMEYPGQGEVDENLASSINATCDACTYAMNDDFNTAKTIAQLFNLSKRINAMHNGNVDAGTLDKETFERMKSTYVVFIEDVLGLKEEKVDDPEFLLEALIDIYKEAKFKKAYDQVDAIRSSLKSGGIILKDMKTGVDWAYEE